MVSSQGSSIDIKNAGLEHPYDMGEMERWYSDDPYVHGIVEKHVDFIVGAGFHIKSKNKNVEVFLEEQMRDFEFQTLLRGWLRRALISNGYLYIQYKDGTPVQFDLLDGKYIYIQLKKSPNGTLTNEVDSYNQFIDFLKTPVPIKFPERNIAHLSFNKVGDNPYGLGIINPLKFTLSKKVQYLKDMSLIMQRKASAPLIIKVGDAEKGHIPSDDEMQAHGQRLESMTNLTDWVVGPYHEFQVINYGDLGKNFTSPMDIINTELTYGSQVPQVLMGVGNIPEGLAAEQMKAWLFRIRSLQEEIERVVEQKIFTPLLLANGFNPKDAEFEWGSPTVEEKRAELVSMQALLALGNPFQPVIGEDLRKKAELKVYELLSLEPPLEDEMELEQPQVPPSAVKREVPAEEHLHEHVLNESELSHTVQEFVGFNYLVYITMIKQFIESKEFEEREYETFKYVPGTHQEEWEKVVSQYSLADTLTIKQVGKLRNVLIEGFEENKRLVDIRQDILDKVKPKTLKITLDNGRKIELRPEIRASIIARTETVRATSQATLQQARSLGAEQVQWIASASERTCNYCIAQNGTILTLREANERQPAHVNCKCGYAIVKIQENNR